LQTLGLHPQKADYRVNWGDFGGTLMDVEFEELPSRFWGDLNILIWWTEICYHH